MAKLDEKMELIGSAIVSQAEQERSSIVEKANKIREEQLSACKEQLIETMFQKLQQQTRAVRQRAIKDKAQAEVKAHRELLARREELATAVFCGAKTKLFEYVATPAYKEQLLADIRSLREKWDHSASTVLLRESDLPLSAEITAILPGAAVEADPAIKIGGFRLRNTAAGILADETLDSRLEEQKPWFLMNSGLKTV